VDAALGYHRLTFDPALLAGDRLGIAGGDTSSIGIQALDLWGLSHAGTIAPGVALCHGHSDDPALHGLEIMLKGGQMGASDLLAWFHV
jgi:uncharacterized protein YgbK (DUF1537 family)